MRPIGVCLALVALCLAGPVNAELPWNSVPQGLDTARPALESQEAPAGEERSAETEAQEGVLSQGGEAMLIDLLKTLGALGAVCLLAYGFVRYVLRNMVRNRSPEGDRFRIIDKFGLEPKKMLYIMEICQQRMLLSTSENEVRFLTRLEERSVTAAGPMTSPQPESQPAAPNLFFERLRKSLDRPAIERIDSRRQAATSRSSQEDVS